MEQIERIAIPNSREAIIKERERIKNANEQNLLILLSKQGIDGTKIPRHEFDKLLRIQKEMSMHERQMQDRFKQFLEIVAPYKPVMQDIGQCGVLKEEPVVEVQAQQ